MCRWMVVDSNEAKLEPTETNTRGHFNFRTQEWKRRRLFWNDAKISGSKDTPERTANKYSRVNNSVSRIEKLKQLTIVAAISSGPVGSIKL